MSDVDEEAPVGGAHPDEEVGLPKATISKLANEFANGLAVTKGVKDLLGDCCVEFIHLLSSEGIFKLFILSK